MNANNVGPSSLEGKHLLISAACGGAGRVIAQRCAQTGAKVLAVDIDPILVEQFQREFPHIDAVTADVGNETDVIRVYERIRARFGTLDVLVNNVGIAGPRMPAEDISWTDFADTLRVNVGGHFLCAKYAIPLMKSARAGSIINISSTSARTGLPLRLPYVVSKAAVLSLTHNLSRELGAFGVRVNSVLPGALQGPRLKSLIDARARDTGLTAEQCEREMMQYVSMRCAVSPDDVADTVIFLASDQSRHVTGQEFGVCGGVQYED